MRFGILAFLAVAILLASTASAIESSGEKDFVAPPSMRGGRLISDYQPSPANYQPLTAGPHLAYFAADKEEAQQLMIESKGEAAFFRLEEQIITSASKYAQRIIESPSAIAVITKEDIEKSGARDITDLFRFHPGTMVVESGSVERDVIVRGFPQGFSPRLLVLMDGIPLYNPMTSGVFWTFQPFSLASVERIEIIRGASSTLYGANAFSGVINIISKKVDTKQSFYAYGSGGNLEFTQDEIIWTRPISDKVRFRLSGLFRHDEGYGSGNGDGQFDGQTAGQGMMNWEFDLSEDTSLKFYSYLRFANLKETFTSAFATQSDNIRNIIAGFNLNHNFNDKQNLSFQTTFQDLKWGGFSFTPPDIVRREVNSDLQYTHKFGKRDVLVTGANFREGGFKHTILTKPALENLTLVSFFINNDFKIRDNLILTTGGRYEFDTFTRNQFSGRTNLTFLPWENHAIRASFARAVRTPSVLEERLNLLNFPGAAPFPPGTTLDFLGNSNLNPETVLAAEAGYQGQFLKNRLTTNIQFYFNDIKDLITQGVANIDLTATPPHAVFQFDRRGNGRVYGIESDFTLNILDWWRTSLNYTFTQQQGFVTGRFPKNLLSFKNRFSVKPGISIEILFNWTSRYNFFDILNGVSTPIGNIFRVDARIAKKFYKDRFEVSVAGQNLIDAPHSEHSTALRVDRSFYGMVSFLY